MEPPRRRRRNRIENWSDHLNSEEILAAAALATCRVRCHGSPAGVWTPEHTARRTVEGNGKRSSNGPGEGGKGLRSSPSTTPGVRRQLPLLPIWTRSGNTGTRSLLGAARLIAADDAGRRAVGKPTILRSGTRDPQYCLAGCLPEPSKPCAHVGEAVPSLRRSPLLTVHHPAPASETMIAAAAVSTPPRYA